MKTAAQDFFSSFDHIFCLSLNRCADRRVYMQKLVDTYAINNFSFVDAIDSDDHAVQSAFKNGQVAKFPTCFRCKKLTCGDETCNNTLIPPQVATFLSYIKLWRQFLSSPAHTVLIVEDDIKLVSDFEQKCKALRSTDWMQLSQLQSQKPALLQLGWAYCDEHRLATTPSISDFKAKMSNPCFAINRQMAEQLLSNVKDIDTTVDIYTHRRVCNQDNAKTLFPPLFYEMSWSTGEVESTIHPKQVRIDYLLSSNKNRTEIEDAMSSLSSHQKHTHVYPVVALGHPRCGSGYTAKLLTALGVDVGHEALQKDGISSWMFAVDDDCPWALNEGARTRNFKYFKHTIHHVRDPRTAIPSIMRDNIHAPKSYDFRRKHIMQSFDVDLDSFNSNFTKAVASYIYWNELIIQQKPSFQFRVEDQALNLATYLQESREFELSKHPVYPDKRINANKLYQGKSFDKPNVHESEFNGLHAKLKNKLNALCNKFGYEEFTLNTFDKPTFIKQLENATLKPTGWLRSAQENASVSNDGEPLPWWTLPATEFIHSVLSKHWRVFEYGCGNSTLWWAKHITQVCGVDHDSDWVNKVKPQLQKPHSVFLSEIKHEATTEAINRAEPYFARTRKLEFGYDDAKMVRRGLNDRDFINYADTINKVGGKFDCIVIDGMARRLCAQFAIDKLTENGIVIFDNSNRSDYLEGYQTLIENGFYQIRFSGPVAGATFPSCTSIFIKSLASLPKVVFEPSMFGINEY